MLLRRPCLALHENNPIEVEAGDFSPETTRPQLVDDGASEAVDRLTLKQPHIGVSCLVCHKNTSFSGKHHNHASFLRTREVPTRQALVNHLIDQLRLIDP